MTSAEISVLIDYAIVLFHKFSNFAVKNNFKVEGYSGGGRKNQVFVIQQHTIWSYRKAVRDFNPVAGVKLNYEEKKFVLLLLGGSLYGQNGVNIWQAMCFFHRLPFLSLRALGRIMDPAGGFIKSSMVMFQDSDSLGSSLNIEDIADFYNNRKVFLSPFALNSLFSNFIGKNIYGITQYRLATQYANIDELLNDITNIMKYLFFLSSFFKLNYAASFIKDDIYVQGEFALTLKRFQRTIIKSGLKIPLVQFLKDHTLTNIEFVVLLYFIHKVVTVKEFIISNIDEILANIAFIPSQIKFILKCFAKDSLFVKENFIAPTDYYPPYPYPEDQEGPEMENMPPRPVPAGEEGEFEGLTSNFTSISITKDKIYNLIFSDGAAGRRKKKGKAASVQAREDEKTGDASRARGLYEIVVPKVTLENVILEEDVKRELLGAVDLTKAADTMKKWGVKPNLNSSAFGSVKILLYGPSGTGKTITAQALSGEAGSDLFKVDASNLVSSWVGESTRNVKKVFREFYRYAKSSKKRVFLFMNEADQLLSARGAVMQAADKEYNQMQNLLLEELENFDGVFIATTNLVDLFDTAWNRRFNVKIRFDVPKYETRLRLWQVHVNDKMPLSPDVDFRKLAEYELAGGSIANVVYNAARKAALRDEGQRFVTQKDFSDAIQNEIKSHIGAKASRVGFQQ